MHTYKVYFTFHFHFPWNILDFNTAQEANIFYDALRKWGKYRNTSVAEIKLIHCYTTNTKEILFVVKRHHVFEQTEIHNWMKEGF